MTEIDIGQDQTSLLVLHWKDAAVDRRFAEDVEALRVFDPERSECQPRRLLVGTVERDQTRTRLGDRGALVGKLIEHLPVRLPRALIAEPLVTGAEVHERPCRERALCRARDALEQGDGRRAIVSAVDESDGLLELARRCGIADGPLRACPCGRQQGDCQGESLSHPANL